MSDSFLIRVIRVADLRTSLTFYRDKLGFTVDWMDPDIRTAQLTAPAGEVMVVTADPELDVPGLYPAEQVADNPEGINEEATVAEDQAEEPIPAQDQAVETEEAVDRPESSDPNWEDPPLVEEVENVEEESVPAPEAVRWQFREVEAGGRLSFVGENLIRFQEHLSVMAVPDLLLEESPGVEQILTLKDPDGYEIAFQENLRLADDALLELYRKGPDLLEGALLGLTEEDLDLTVEDEVTIRQLVLQIVDFDLEMMQRIKWALAESGRSYPIPLYEPEIWAEALAYRRRPTHVELSMFRLLREHVLLLCETLEGALDHHLVSEQGTVEVRTMMQVVAEMSREQIQSILDARHRHGK